MVVACGRRTEAEQLGILRHSPDHRHAEDKELGVIVRIVPGIKEVVAGVGGHREVVVLAAAVDPGEWLLVKQADQAILLGGLLHEVHDQHVVVRGEV